MANVLSLTSKEAKAFLMKQQSYCNFDIPEYFVFEPVLNAVDKKIKDKSVTDFYDIKTRPRESADVNHKLISNKDGKYAWRPFQLIHPAIYVELVNLITEPKNWKFLVNRFNELKKSSPNIHCQSLPVSSKRYVKDKSEQISQWSSFVEKESIVSALDFEYLYHTDITDCYGSIYTHTIAWALDGKVAAKKSRGKKGTLGEKIDKCLQDMSQGQTNGIPQGSTLMDLIAEMVLFYIDFNLSERIQNIKRKDYKIIRYRDDYRIFTNNPQLGEQILKELTDVLHSFGMRISSGKTIHSNDVIHSSVKADKVESWLEVKNFENLTSEIYSISIFALRFPNSGQLMVKLSDFFKKIEGLSKKEFVDHIGVLIAVTVDIACRNPRTYPTCAAILSKLLFISTASERKRYVKKLQRKFSTIPNTNIMQLWLQRIKVDFVLDDKRNEPLCKVVLNEPTTIWNSSWLNKSLAQIISTTSIVDREKLKDMPHVISLAEIELFIKEY